MVITKIERQKRSRNRVNVYIDGEFTAGLDDDVLVKFGLRKGDTIDKETFSSIVSSEEIHRARNTALQFIGYRMRSEKEVKTKLTEKEFPPDIIDMTIQRLREQNILNDKTFAEAFVKQQLMLKPAGKTFFRQRLRMKGIDKNLIDDVLSEYVSSSHEDELAFAAADKLLRQYRNSRKSIDDKKLRARIASFLARRGFAWSSISPTLKQLFNQKSFD